MFINRIMDLLKTLIAVSEKAANIARICRQDEHLFDLLIQKKKCDEANPRFVEDFKTLADVLIQEMVKHDLKDKFQEFSDSIIGEENNIFNNKLGETVCVQIQSTEKQTSELLQTVLNGDQIAANLLAEEVHKEIKIGDIKTKLPQEDFDIKLHELGIWIDPIDCTIEYINGGKGACLKNIHLYGLKCVTILIGVFNKVTGAPVIGVVNRPFMEENDFSWPQKCIWGFSLPNLSLNSDIKLGDRRDIICLSSSEKSEVKQKLQDKGFHLIETCGAGYKILAVILGLADAYLLTKGTTFKWDTCGPHSILKSLGGDIIKFQEAIQDNEQSLTYFVNGDKCNTSGIIAYRQKDVLNSIIDALKY